jgi:hypothetical protein
MPPQPCEFDPASIRGVSHQCLFTHRDNLAK